jgi:hypothetical protein
MIEHTTTGMTLTDDIDLTVPSERCSPWTSAEPLCSLW